MNKLDDLYVVRLYDGFDHEWMDVFGPDTKEACETRWRDLTKNGTRSSKYADIDYYEVFPADTRMVFSEEGKRDFGLK